MVTVLRAISWSSRELLLGIESALVLRPLLVGRNTIIYCSGNPERVPTPSRDAPLPAKPAGSARECNGNPERVPTPSRDAPLPAKPAGSARECNGNPERVPTPSRDAPLPAKPAGSARECI